MIINDLDGYYIVFDTKNWNTELDTLIFNASYDVPNSAQKTIYKDVILAKYTSNSGDSGGIVYALTKATNTRYTVGINLGSITYNGITYGACIKAYLINQTFGLTRY